MQCEFPWIGARQIVMHMMMTYIRAIRGFPYLVVSKKVNGDAVGDVRRGGRGREQGVGKGTLAGRERKTHGNRTEEFD